MPNLYEERINQVGYFAQLGVTFKSPGDEIKLNYLKKMEVLLAGRSRLSLKNDRYIIKELMKVVNAYKVLENEKNRIKYLNRLRLRSLASQYTSIVP